jgi:hypothetical protein
MNKKVQEKEERGKGRRKVKTCRKYGILSSKREWDT